MACPDRIPGGGFQGEIIPQEILPAGFDNSFVRFLNEQNKNVVQYARATSELSEEEQLWRASPHVDALVGFHLRIVDDYTDVDYDAMSRKQKRHYEAVRRMYVQRIFQNTTKEDVERQRRQDMHLFKGNTYKQRMYEQIEAGVDVVRQDYLDVRRPLVDTMITARIQLEESFRNHVEENYEHLIDMATFLHEESFQEFREGEDVRAALSAIAKICQGKGTEKNTLEAVRQQHAIVLKNRPTDAVFDRFATSEDEEMGNYLFFLAVAVRELMPQLQWPEMKDEDIERVFTNNFLRDVFVTIPPKIWPSHLRATYHQYIDAETLKTVTTIRKGFESYQQPEQPPKEVPIFFPQKRRVKTRGIPAEDQNILQATEQEEQRDPFRYRIGELYGTKHQRGIRIVSEEAIDTFVKKAAGKIAKNDERMVNDITNILISLREEPYTVGVRKIGSVIIEGKDIKLLRLHPQRRHTLGLPLTHPESDRVRVVYSVIPRDNDTPVIAVYGIYHHNRYDQVMGYK